MIQERLQDYFNYIVDRQIIWYKKEVLKEEYPWSEDEFFKDRKFCNNFRILDRGTKYILKRIIKTNLSDQVKLFNIIAYRIFNREGIFENAFGEHLDPYNFDFKKYEKILDEYIQKGNSVFSAAYLITQVPFNAEYRKREKHVQCLMLLQHISDNIDDIHDRLSNSSPYESIDVITSLRNIGEFLGFQIVLDLIYFPYFKKGWNDDDMVVMGPGAIGGVDTIYGKPLRGKEYIAACKKLRDVQQDFLVPRAKLLGYDWETISTPLSVTYPWLSLCDIEYTLCEGFKMYKARHKGKRLKWYKR